MGRRSLARAVTEYAVVALLATLLAAAGGTAVDQQPTDRPTRVEARPRPRPVMTSRRCSEPEPSWSRA